ncbi:MAG: hypothetical protein V2I33_23670 [Kangiellaceae bacterium]|nr:hypothetical protein [Kangiellaceae bacterium]
MLEKLGCGSGAVISEYSASDLNDDRFEDPIELHPARMTDDLRKFDDAFII